MGGRELEWSRVHLGDEIGAEGQVCEIHERDDGLTVFVIRNARLVKHVPKPRQLFKLWTVATTATTALVNMSWLTAPKDSSHDQ